MTNDIRIHYINQLNYFFVTFIIIIIKEVNRDISLIP